MSFVSDSSVTLNWCFPNEHTQATIALLRDSMRRAIFVPAIWPFEMSNVLGTARRKGRISEMDLQTVTEMIISMDLHIEPSPRLSDISRLLGTMSLHTLTAYDAAYLLLAQNLKLPLATLDTQLAHAAKLAGVPLLL
jgi:predicted nucleic acid-binding protein